MSNNNKNNLTEHKFSVWLRQEYPDLVGKEKFLDPLDYDINNPWERAFRIDTNAIKAAQFVRDEFYKLGKLDGVPVNRVYWKCKKLIIKQPELLEIIFL